MRLFNVCELEAFRSNVPGPLRYFQGSSLYLLSFVRLNGPRRCSLSCKYWSYSLCRWFTPAPSKQQTWDPTKNTLQKPFFILYFSIFYSYLFLFITFISYITILTREATRKGNKWNLTENTYFCHLGRNRLSFKMSRQKQHEHSHMKTQEPVSSVQIFRLFLWYLT